MLKNNFFKKRKSSIIPLGIVIISIFGFLIIISSYTDKNNLQFTAEEIQEKAILHNYQTDTASLAYFPQKLYVDIRSSEEFRIDHQDGAINIPFSSLLDETYHPLFSSEKTKIILSDDPIKAHETWMLLNQLGYTGIYVLDELSQ